MKKAVRGEALESIDARLEELERKIDRLRVLYENFFMGVERIPPNVPRREVNRLMLETQQAPIGNASLRFRFQTLLQRWVLLTTYWNRTMREIEAGTYRRDLAKAHRHISARGEVPISEEEALRMGIPASRAKAFTARHNRQVEGRAGTAASDAAAAASKPPPARPADAPPPASAPPPAAAGSAALPGLRAGALEDFYNRYVQAHTAAVGAPPKASLDQMRAKLQQDLPRILAEQRCESVELDVAVDGGKVRFRARPVK